MINIINYIISGEYNKFYNSRQWRRKSHEAMKRDNFECQLCKKEGKVKTRKDKTKRIKLEVHHLISIKINPYKAMELSNLITLCTNHHNIIHNKEIAMIKPVKKKTFINTERW